MSIQQPPVSLVKTEPPTVTENEPPEYEIAEIVMDEIFNTSDIKDIDIVSHTLSEDLIKSENMFESKYSECVETQVFVKTENAPLVKIENIIEKLNKKLNKSEDTNNGNGHWGTSERMEDNTMYQCLYCSFKSKWRSSLRLHIIRKHKDWKDIQCVQCHLCELKFKVKSNLTQHMKIHLKHKQMQDELDLCEKR